MCRNAPVRTAADVRRSRLAQSIGARRVANRNPPGWKNYFCGRWTAWSVTFYRSRRHQKFKFHRRCDKKRGKKRGKNDLRASLRPVRRSGTPFRSINPRDGGGEWRAHPGPTIGNKPDTGGVRSVKIYGFRRTENTKKNHDLRMRSRHAIKTDDSGPLGGVAGRHYFFLTIRRKSSETNANAKRTSRNLYTRPVLLTRRITNWFRSIFPLKLFLRKTPLLRIIVRIILITDFKSRTSSVRGGRINQFVRAMFGASI